MNFALLLYLQRTEKKKIMAITDKTNTRIITLPVLPLRGLVAFPNMLLTLDVGRKKSVKALERAMESDRLIYLITQKDISVDDPKEDDLYKIGCICKIRQVLKIADGVKVLVEGKCRATHKTFAETNGSFVSLVEEQKDDEIKNRAVYIESLIRRIRTQFDEYASVSPVLSKDVALTVASNGDVSFLCDFIAFNVPAPYDDKQYILEQVSPIRRAKLLIELLNKEKEICEIDNRISEKTKKRIDDNQKDYYLKEQLHAISEELYGDEGADEIDTYYTKIDVLNAPEKIKEKIANEVTKLSKMPQGSHDGAVLRTWLDTVLALPFGESTNPTVNIKKAAKILDRDFYGMNKVKERILETLSVYALNKDAKLSQIICLAGPPGVGKTSIGKTIAECMGRSYERVSLGGMNDEAEIRGHRKTYIGAMAGRIMKAVSSAGVSNPLILLDEIDKLSSDYKGDPSSALLEVLDYEQNANFCDHYIELPFDLSKVVFITTANDISAIPAPLRDRMDIIEIDGYTREEKFRIAKYHLVKRQLESHALSNKTCKISDSAIYAIIDFYTREAGVRNLERTLGTVFGKAARILAENECDCVKINADTLEKMLGKHKFKPEEISKEDEVGLINGLAWTLAGGEIMQLEAAVLDGTGKIELTGSLGDVMKESAKAAITFIRANSKRYGIDTEFYKNKDIHVHATEAAVPKDGPSAGVTITTAVISALTNRKIRRDIAMTGEVSIRGRVLPIGGLKEKSMAAYRGGVKTVFIPKDNIPDLDDVDETVKKNVRFIPVSDVAEIIDKALLEPDDGVKENYTIPAAKGETGSKYYAKEKL